MSQVWLAAVPPPAAYGGAPAFRKTFRFMEPVLPALNSVTELYRRAYEQGLITNGDLVARFESAVAERLGVRHCVAVSSCTSGLTLVCRALDLRGEVIVPSFTFFATGHSVLWNGLTPVLADCDLATWNIDPNDAASRITERTSAILAVHLYGNACDVDSLSAIAARNNLKLIFDAAHAFGSSRDDVPVGRFGDAEVFSLSPTKPLVAGEGGLVVTNDAVLARRLRLARNYGDAGAYDCELLGANARMSEFNAALALAGLDLVDAKIKRHNAIARIYTEELSMLDGVGFQHVSFSDVSSYKDYSIHLQPSAFGMTADELAVALRAENIETKKYFYPPLHQQRLYRPFTEAHHKPLTITDYVATGILSLPIYASLSDDCIRDIARAIRRIVEYQKFAAY